MKKIYKKLSKERREKGIMFTSTLSNSKTEQEEDSVAIVYAKDDEIEERIRRLKNDKFFDESPWEYNIIRT
jgi:hypothetical protein